MRVGLDIRWIFRETSGIGTYTRELVRELVRIDVQNEYVLFYDDETIREALTRYAELSGCKNVRFERAPHGLFSLKNQLRLPALLRGCGLDVYHSPNYMIPYRAIPRDRTGRMRCVVTLHDVIPLKFPEFTPRARKNRIPGLFRFLMVETARRADWIITVSECSRRDVIEELHIPPDRANRVVAIPNGVASEFFSVMRPPRAEGAPRTLLYVGRFDPYKNLAGLMDIFAEVRRRAKTDVRLRIIGSPDPRYPEPLRRAQELGLTPWIEWCGYCGGEELAQAYAAADLLVLPSRYEGFGLTVLEAMASGTPVVCSNRASLPEVAGDAAWMADPDDVPAFAGAILRIISDSRLASMLAKRGRERAQQFTWARTARATLAVYEAAGQDRDEAGLRV